MCFRMTYLQTVLDEDERQTKDKRLEALNMTFECVDKPVLKENVRKGQNVQM